MLALLDLITAPNLHIFIQPCIDKHLNGFNRMRAYIKPYYYNY